MIKKTIALYNYSELDKKIRKRKRKEAIEQVLKDDLHLLDEELRSKEITEKEYYNQLGCSKHYAETTSWFVPSCYYEEHKKAINTRAMELLKNRLYRKNGKLFDKEYVLA